MKSSISLIKQLVGIYCFYFLALPGSVTADPTPPTVFNDLTADNWKNHPRIIEIRKECELILKGVRTGSLSPVVSPTGNSIAYFDNKGVMRYYDGSLLKAVRREYFYKENGKILFAYVKDDNSRGMAETRSYYEPIERIAEPFWTVSTSNFGFPFEEDWNGSTTIKGAFVKIKNPTGVVFEENPEGKAMFLGALQKDTDELDIDPWPLAVIFQGSRLGMIPDSGWFGIFKDSSTKTTIARPVDLELFHSGLYERSTYGGFEEVFVKVKGAVPELLVRGINYPSSRQLKYTHIEEKDSGWKAILGENDYDIWIGAERRAYIRMGGITQVIGFASSVGWVHPTRRCQPTRARSLRG
jgi:hypothetical protein